MGYYVQIDDIDFTIPAEKLADTYTALCALNTDPQYADKKSGGSWGVGGRTASWFSWMTENYHETLTSAEDIFKELGFDTSTDDEGNLSLLGYDNKTGAEDLFIEHAGKFADEGWYIIWRGDDGGTWKVTAEGTKEGRVVFE